jgi:hypothetical protein
MPKRAVERGATRAWQPGALYCLSVLSVENNLAKPICVLVKTYRKKKVNLVVDSQTCLLFIVVNFLKFVI